MSLDEAAEQFHALMMDSVRLRLRSDVPVGVNLSGGLDSSSLLSFVDAQSGAPQALNYFTYAFDDPAYDETDFADSVPKRKTWHKQVARLDPQILWNDLESMMWHQEAPYGGTGTLAYYNLHRLIRQTGVTVVLEGQGVDELLAGYAYYRLKPEDGPTYQDGTSFLKDSCLNREFLNSVPSTPVFEKPFASALSNRLYQDLRHTKLPRVLRMNDRLSMAFSRELREPFLDHRVVEFCFRLPDEYKMNKDGHKILLRHAMKSRLPDEVRLTNKRAVVTPQREWIRGPLKDPIHDLINSRDFSGYSVFDVPNVKHAFENFCKGEGDNAFFIWQWINFDCWFRLFKNQGRASERRKVA
ncbi:MAG: asparagine synthetase B family protein [Alphaproteobacteria bacterium]